MSPTILCVDSANDGRSPFAQAYLELLRTWLANTGKHRPWIFKDVSSAGAFITSEFSRKHSADFHKHSSHFPKDAHSLIAHNQDRTNLDLRAFNKQGTYDGSEKRTVMARVGNRKIRGIRAVDFQKDFILCFDEPMYELLKVMKQAATNDAHGHSQPAQIHLINIRSDLHKHDYEIRDAKAKLREWAAKNLGWTQPSEAISGGFWRTRQVVIPEAGYRALFREHEKRLTALKEESTCDFHFSGEWDDGWRLVSIVGRRDKIQETGTKVLESW
jgi:hypothetical protein